MAPTATQEEGGEGPGSRSRARKWRRSTRTRRRSKPTETTPSRVRLLEPPASSSRRRAGAGAGAAAAKKPSRKRKASRSRPVGKSRTAEDVQRTTRSSSPGQELDAAAPAPAPALAASKQSKKRKSVMAADEGSAGEENVLRRRRSLSGLEKEAAASASAATEQASSASSAVSSPLRQPYFKPVVREVDSGGEETLESLSNIDPAIDAYEEHHAKYAAKKRRQLNLVTLKRVPRSCTGNYWYGRTHEPAVETVLKTAKIVLGLSSYIDGKLLKRASGFIIEWNKESKVVTVVTSALLICTKSPSFDEWLAKDEFAPHAEVHVHLLDKNDTTATAQLIHYHKHYNLALFEIKMDLVAPIPSFSADVKYAQEIFVLGRHEDQCLTVNHGIVVHKGPSSFNRHHTMYTSCKLNECCLGGPVIELNGQFLGLISRPGMKFIPSPIILKCLRMLKKFNCIPRLHTGMKFSAIRFLDPVHREKIYRKCSVEVGLIVTEVSEGSIAEKVGIRNGDIVECWSGELVSTTFELENNLLRMCEEHLDKGYEVGSNVEIPVGIYHVRKDSRCTVILTLKVRDDVEEVARGEYDVSRGISAIVSPGDQDSGHEKPHGTGEDELGES